MVLRLLIALVMLGATVLALAGVIALFDGLGLQGWWWLAFVMVWFGGWFGLAHLILRVRGSR